MYVVHVCVTLSSLVGCGLLCNQKNKGNFVHLRCTYEIQLIQVPSALGHSTKQISIIIWCEHNYIRMMVSIDLY